MVEFDGYLYVGEEPLAWGLKVVCEASQKQHIICALIDVDSLIDVLRAFL